MLTYCLVERESIQSCCDRQSQNSEPGQVAHELFVPYARIIAVAERTSPSRAGGRSRRKRFARDANLPFRQFDFHRPQTVERRDTKTQRTCPDLFDGISETAKGRRLLDRTL